MPFDVPWVAANFPNLIAITKLAKGGQKTVFRVEHPIYGVSVLKIFEPGQDLETTRRELLAVSQVKAPNTPCIFESGIVASGAGDCIWFCEQFIEGECLRDVIDNCPLTLQHTFALAQDILSVLEMTESVGIVHRDVKPENIIQSNQGRYWLIDFGIARHLNLSSLTATASPWGKLTVGYAPPEQFRNDKPSIDSRADLFALGVTLVEAYTGQNPFYGPPSPNQLEVIRRVETQMISCNFGLSAEGVALAGFVSTLTQRRRDLRPRTASEAMTWLKSLIGTI